MKLLCLTLSIFLLTSCSPEIPSCGDEGVKETLIQLLSDKLLSSPSPFLDTKKIAVLDIKETKQALLLKNIRPTALDKTIKQYSCVATLEYNLKKPKRFAEKLENMNGLGQMAELIDGHGGNALQKMSKALHDVYSSSDGKITTDVHYTSQLVDGGDTYVSFEVDSIDFSGFQLSLITDKGSMNEAEANEAKAKTSIILNDVSEEANVKQAANIVLDDKDLNIISKMPKKFEDAYKSGGVIQLRTERSQCYEAASQLNERTLVIQCIAFDSVACAVVPAIEKSNNWPSETDFSGNKCFQRAQKGASSLYQNVTERDEFANLVIEKSMKALEDYNKELNH